MSLGKMPCMSSQGGPWYVLPWAYIYAMKKAIPYLLIFLAVLAALLTYDYYKEYKFKKAIREGMDRRYEAKKTMGFKAFPKSDSFPIPVFEESVGLMIPDEKPIGYIHEFEEVLYLKKNGIAIKLNSIKKTIKP